MLTYLSSRPSCVLKAQSPFSRTERRLRACSQAQHVDAHPSTQTRHRRSALFSEVAVLLALGSAPSAAQGAQESGPSQPDLQLIQGSVRYEPSPSAQCSEYSANSNEQRVVSGPPASCRPQSVPVRMYLPNSQEGARAWPLVAVLSPGFLVSPGAYDSYLRSLATSGVPAAVYDVAQSATDPLDDVACSEVLGSVMRWCQDQGELGLGCSQQRSSSGRSNPCPGPGFVLVGHSRGAKVSAIQASHAAGAGESAASRVSGLCLFDPADASFESVGAENLRSPSGAKLLGSPTLAALPKLIIGAGRNKDCIPSSANFDSFFSQARCATLLKLSDVGHFAFLDFQTLLQQSACSLGKANSSAVRQASAACLSSFVSSLGSTDPAGASCSTANADMFSCICASFGLKHELHVKQT